MIVTVAITTIACENCIS